MYFMSAVKGKKQFGSAIINEVKEMVSQEKTQKEIRRRKQPKDFQEARLLIDDYIYFYNYERIQLKTKLTPCEKRCQFT